ncbi:MAG: hypothetical protein IKI03_01880 [Clostridia bacterium]|nr:hypothetical protein [Clostridia bacterium]
MKKAVVLLLIFVLCLSTVSCGNSADRKSAEDYAVKEADSFYEKYLEYRSFDGGFVCDHETRISNTKFSSGNYTVTVDLVIKGKLSDSTLVMPLHTMKITYTLQVTNGSVKQLDVNYQN